MESFVQWLQEQAPSQPLTDYRALRCYLVDQLGYSNRGKAFRRIDALLQQGRLDNELRDRLAMVLKVSPAVIDEKIGAAREDYFRQQRESLFASSGPHLIAIVPRPEQIFIAGITQDHKRYVKLPTELPQRSEEKQRAFLQKTILEFIAREGTSIPMFGPISGFAYVNSPHTHWLMDTQGQFVEQRDAPFFNRVFAFKIR